MSGMVVPYFIRSVPSAEPAVAIVAVAIMDSTGWVGGNRLFGTAGVLPTGLRLGGNDRSGCPGLSPVRDSTCDRAYVVRIDSLDGFHCVC